MRLLFRLLAGAALATGLVRAESTVQFGPPASWVVPEQLAQWPPTPPGDVSYGYDFLQLDTQVSVREQETYVHRVYRVTAEGSLQSASRLTLDFNPSYQRLTVHHLRVIRDGQVEDRLKTTPVKVIQQERDLDRHMLNGELTALWVLEDIRVGDVVDYAYTQRGWNPALGRSYFSRVPTGWAVPVRSERFRLVAPAGHLPANQSHGPGRSEPLRSKLGNDEVLTWTGRDLAPIAEDGETPDWYEAYPAMQLSEYTSWGQVVRWAEPLYALPDPIPESVRRQAEKLTAGARNPGEQAAALLQFVQQEIRYLGMELGTGSYRPNPPDQVLSRRFGDCKDKTMLFCAMGRAVGLTVYPALLHTTYGRHIEGWLPTPLAFDHVIAVLSLPGGKMLWTDPTLTYQKGEIPWRGLPDYESALIIRPGNDRFTPVDAANMIHGTTVIEETIDVPAFTQPSHLHIRSTYTGRDADGIRREFAQNRPAEISKSYVNYYASAYPGLQAIQPPRMSEIDLRNIVFVDEDYTLPSLWKHDGTTHRWRAEFYPKPIIDLAQRPTAPVRTMPLAISHPRHAVLTTTVKLPMVWKVNPAEKTMESDGFRGRVGISVRDDGRTVTMHYTWDTKADHVEPAQVAQHIEALNRFRDALGYTLTHSDGTAVAPPDQSNYRVNWLLVLVVLLTLTATGLVIRATLARNHPMPPSLPAPGDERLVGLGGWLILVGIGVTVTPFRVGFLSVWRSRQWLNQTTWEAITLPGTASYRENLGPLLLGEISGNLVLFIGAIWLVILFYGRRRLFPKVFIGVVSFALVMVLTDLLLAEWLMKVSPENEAKAAGELTRCLVQALIWIPYMLKSRRVRLTFTR